MTKHVRRVLLVLSLLLSAGIVGSRAHAVSAAAPITLRYHFRVGAQFSVHLTQHIVARQQVNQPGQSGTFREQDGVDITATVLQVLPDGSAFLRLDYAHATASGKDITGAPATPPHFSSTLHLAADGRALSLGSHAADDVQPFVLPQLPSRPVAVGATWPTVPTLTLFDVSQPLPPLAQGASPRDVARAQAQLLAATASTATIGENQYIQITETQKAQTATVTAALTRTEQLARTGVALLRQHSAALITIRFSVRGGHGSLAFHEVDDIVAIPNPPLSAPRSGVLRRIAAVPVGPSPTGIVVDSASGHAFVANDDNNTVTMFDTRTLKQVRVTTVGLGAWTVALDAPRHQVVALSTGATISYEDTHAGRPHTAGTISILSAATGKVLHTIHAGIYPYYLTVDERHARAYITDSTEKVLVVDTAHGRLLAPIAMPAGLTPFAAPVVDSPRDRLYVLASGQHGGGALVIIDMATGARLHVTPLHDVNLERLGYDAGTHHLFVTSEQQGEAIADLGTLTTFDATTGAILHVARHFGSEPDHLAIDGALHHLFVVDSPGRQVLMADTRTGMLLRAIPVRDEPDVITSDAATRRIFVAHDTGTLAILDAASGAVRGYTPIGDNPYRVVDDHASGHIFVVSESDDAVDVFADR